MAALTHLGFETPTISASTFSESQLGSALTDTAWVFGGGTGLAYNNSSIVELPDATHRTAQEGNQVAFLTVGGGRIEQSFTATTGTYALTFYAAWAGRSSQIHIPPRLVVRIDGVGVWSIPNYPTAVGLTTSYVQFTISGIALVTGTTYKLSFTAEGSGLGGDSNIILLDLVALS